MWKQMIKQSFQEPEYYKGIYLNKEIQFSFCGYEDCKKGHKFGPFVRNYFIIHYIKSGKGTFEIGTRKYHLEKKQGFLIVPNVETTYYADNKEPWSYYWLAFNGTSILPLLNKMNLSLSNPVFTYEGDTDIGRLFTETLEPAQSNDIAYLRQMRLLYTFLHEISIGRNLEDTKADQDIYILKATQYIKAYLHKSISVTEIADYIGDSFYLSKVAVELEEQTIVFCGVSFMGESAKVLNPQKTVLMPDAKADCAMAHMADEETIRAMRKKYDDLAVVCYINSTAELKRLSDVCVTSANAVRIVKALPNKNIFFIPDRNLAHFVAEQTPEKNFVYNEGYCPIHETVKIEELKQAKAEHPEAEVLTHPECPKSLLDLSDYIGSTSGIIDRVGKSDAEEFIICTENGVRYELEKRYPNKKFYFTKTEPVCEDMKMITLEKIAHVLRTGENEVQMDEALRAESKKPLEKMLDLAK